MNLLSLHIVSTTTNILQNELQSFLKKNSSSKVAEMFATDPNGNDICVRVLPKTTAFQTLLKTNRLAHKYVPGSDVPEPRAYNSLFSSITKSIVNIVNAGNFYECLDKIRSIKESLGPLFYGALLLDDAIMINPLHPLVAMRMLSLNNATEPSRNYRLAIFTYSSPENYAKLYTYYQEALVDIDKITANINAQIQCYATKVDAEVRLLDSSNNGSTAEITYKLLKHPDELTDAEYYLSAHQVLTEGIAMPYYGTSIIKLSEQDSTGGISITPMRSCNISQFTDFVSTFTNDSTPFEKVQVPFDSVCTGSESNKTLKGIRTLTHSNASSPYTRDIIAAGSLTYAAECINKSFQIYTQANLLKEQ